MLELQKARLLSHILTPCCSDEPQT